MKVVVLNANDDELTDLLRRMGLSESSEGAPRGSTIQWSMLGLFEASKETFCSTQSLSSPTETEGLTGLLQLFAGSIQDGSAFYDSSKRDMGGQKLTPSENERLLAVADDLLKHRDARSKSLKMEIFGDPAWYVLLDLFIQKCRRKQTLTKRAVIISGVSASAVGRHLNVLEAEGLVVRKPHASDKRVVLIELTGVGERKMREIIRRIAQTSYNCIKQLPT